MNIVRAQHLAFLIILVFVATILSAPLTAIVKSIAKLPKHITAAVTSVAHSSTPYSFSAAPAVTAMSFYQHTISLAAKTRGCHLVTNELLSKPLQQDIQRLNIGVAHFFIQHTSCGLTINENADRDVRVDMEKFFRALVPDDTVFAHDAEGPDDMTGHIKSSIFGVSLTVPITRGRLNLGTWQGIWLIEGRISGGNRSVVVTLQGQA